MLEVSERTYEFLPSYLDFCSVLFTLISKLHSKYMYILCVHSAHTDCNIKPFHANILNLLRLLPESLRSQSNQLKLEIHTLTHPVALLVGNNTVAGIGEIRPSAEKR